MVLVSSTVGFGQGEAAGTGMVIDDSGIVVTNHHVVEGATSIEVTVASTGPHARLIDELQQRRGLLS
jgi:S1-C subfamily serine protease